MEALRKVRDTVAAAYRRCVDAIEDYPHIAFWSFVALAALWIA